MNMFTILFIFIGVVMMYLWDIDFIPETIQITFPTPIINKSKFEKKPVGLIPK